MQHGTVRMYRKELRDKQKGGPGPCALCKRAQADYIDGYRLLKTRDRTSEAEAYRVRRKALNRLTAEYPERFAALLVEETASAELL